MRILLFEEKKSLTSTLNLRTALQKQGFKVDVSGTCKQAEKVIKLVPYGAVILNFSLAGEMGAAVLCQWRKAGLTVPVLVLTCHRDAMVNILNAGADDCMQKPVIIPELIARLGAIIRRSCAHATTLLRHDDVTLDTGSRVVKQRGIVIKLTSREMAMLEIFLLHKKRIIRREYLHQHFSSWHRDVSSNVIEVHISHLRRKLGSNFIQTIWGEGYKLGEEP